VVPALTVNVYLIFNLGRLDVMPASDLGIRRGVQLIYGLEDSWRRCRRFTTAWFGTATRHVNSGAITMAASGSLTWRAVKRIQAMSSGLINTVTQDSNRIPIGFKTRAKFAGDSSLEEAVCCEPVSGVDSLVTGKNTGKSTRLAPPPTDSRRKRPLG
jgi:hypothetical protein